MTGIVAVIVALVSLAAPTNVRVTNDNRVGGFTRLDGTTDAVLQGCSQGRRPQADPSVAIDPRNPNVIVVAALTDCPSIATPVGYFDLGWAGYSRSTDGGRTWTNTLVPGYPGDASAAGMTSPTHGLHLTAEHVVAFDGDGRVFYYFDACIAGLQSTCHSFAAVYDQDGGHYVRTVDLSTLSLPLSSPVHNGFGLQPSIAVDTSSGPRRGTVYATWASFPAFVSAVGVDGEQQVPAAVVVMSRSTDHGVTFSPPLPVTVPFGVPISTAVAVGPDGAVNVAVRYIGSTGELEATTDSLGGTDSVVLARSIDGGLTFVPALVDRLRPFDADRFAGAAADPDNPGLCGDGRWRCASGYSIPDLNSMAAVAADQSGVHVIWNGRLPSGQSKVFVRSSPDGVTWPAPSATIDEVAAGHQYRLSIASDAGAITAGWIDSRVDPVYDPNRPVGNDARGRSGGPSADFWAARSVDGGRTWVERRVSAVTTNPNLEVYEFGRVGFNGDVTGLAAAGGRVYAVWTDNRDVVGGSDPREPGNVDGNDTYLPCTWSPNATDAVSYASPTYGDGCLSRGGLDQNVYGADLTGDWVAASVSAPASAGGVATGPTGVLAVSGADGRFAALGALVLALAFVVRRLR